MDKIYIYPGGQHEFKDGKYIGFFYSTGRMMTMRGEPFVSWDDWDQEKENFLISLGFKLKN